MYVGSAESEEYDQVLDTVVVGPVIVGKHKFVFQVTMVTYRVVRITCKSIVKSCLVIELMVLFSIAFASPVIYWRDILYIHSM